MMSFLCVIVITGCKELITFSSCISLLFRSATIIFMGEITFLSLSSQVLGSKKTVDIFPTLPLVSREMTSEDRLQKFHTDDVSLPRSGLSHVISMEFLSSFFSLHFAGKPMVASGNVCRFVRRPVFAVGFNQNQNPF